MMGYSKFSIANDIVAHNTYLATSSGNVGIGTTKPSLVSGSSDKILEINGSSNPGLAIRDSDSNKQYFLYTGGTSFNIFDANSAVNRFTITTRGDVQIPGANGENFFVDTNDKVLFVNSTSNNVGIGTTGPQNRLEVVGATTLAGGVNASSLNVTGFSITDDSLVTLSDLSKKKIKDIKAGEEVLTLDENTGKLVTSKVNALLDHGIKPIYEMTTEDGRAINTTAEHPYFVKIYKNSKSSGRSLITLPLNSSGECNFSNLEIARFCDSKSLARILNNQIPKCLEEVNCSSVKCLSLVINNLCSDKVSSKTSPFSTPLGDNLTSCPDLDKKENNPLCTFSSNKNLILSRDEFETPFCKLSSKFQRCFDMLFGEGGVCFKNFFMSSTIFEHFQNYRNHDSCAFESRLSMADVGVNNDKIIDFDSHKSDDNYELYKDYENHAQWIEVRYLKVGDEIAVPDYENCEIESDLSSENSQKEKVEWPRSSMERTIPSQGLDAGSITVRKSRRAHTDLSGTYTNNYKKLSVSDGTSNYACGSIKWEKIASIKTLEPQHVYDLSIEGTRNFIENFEYPYNCQNSLREL